MTTKKTESKAKPKAAGKSTKAAPKAQSPAPKNAEKAPVKAAEKGPSTEAVPSKGSKAAPAKTEAAATPAAKPETKPEASAMTEAKGELSATATAILADPSAPSLVGQQAEMLLDARAHIASQAANVVAQVFSARPELVVPHVAKLAKAIVTKNKRVVQVAADTMPAIAKVAPARVARELDFLRAGFRSALEEGQDGLVRTFATLCVASVAYQKRLEPVLTEALAIAEGKTLLRWTQTILPSLKGEPHARARAVVEGRLESLARPLAQPIADFLGIKLRPRR